MYIYWSANHCRKLHYSFPSTWMLCLTCYHSFTIIIAYTITVAIVIETWHGTVCVAYCDKYQVFANWRQRFLNQFNINCMYFHEWLSYKHIYILLKLFSSFVNTWYINFVLWWNGVICSTCSAGCWSNLIYMCGVSSCAECSIEKEK